MNYRARATLCAVNYKNDQGGAYRLRYPYSPNYQRSSAGHPHRMNDVHTSCHLVSVSIMGFLLALRLALR